MSKSINNLLISQLAAETGVPVTSIKYYEKRGILKPYSRTDAGYRLYHPDQCKQLNFIKNTQSLGFTLSEVHELLNLNFGEQPFKEPLSEQIDAKIKDVEVRIQQLQQLHEHLQQLYDACLCNNPDKICPIWQKLTKPSAD